jgi:hypothetical protein
MFSVIRNLALVLVALLAANVSSALLGPTTGAIGTDNLGGTSAAASPPASLYPYTVNDGMIKDASGNLVDMQCVNWPGHMETNLPEGLQFQPLSTIVNHIADSNLYNCVRLTYAVELLSKLDVTARESFTQNNANDDSGFDLSPHIANFTEHNPNLIDENLGTIFQKTAKALGDSGIAVLMSNHVSKSIWCCGFDDGNGWFNDEFFEPTAWQESLVGVAKLMGNLPNVVALDLRNELRTDQHKRNEQIDDFMHYIPDAINAILNGNKDLLVFVSGLSYDNDWKFLDEGRNSQAWDDVLVDKKASIVFESHIYSWSPFGTIEPGESCDHLTFDEMLGWPVKNGFPMVLSEIGTTIDSFSDPSQDLTWWNCVRDFILEYKQGYAMWLLAGSYYYRAGDMNHPDSFGLLETDFSGYKNQEVIDKNREMQWLNERSKKD